MKARNDVGLFLAITVLGMIVAVSSRPLPHDSDILSGVDFLSMFIHSARSTTRSPRISFISASTTESSTQPVEDNTVTIFEDDITTTAVVTVSKDTSAIVANSRRSDFSVDESEVVMISDKVKRKSEDFLAIGANPDYIAQQQSRLRENIHSYNHPYTNRQPSSRSRSVSYSAVIQSLSNTPVIPKPKDYNNNNDYDYTESYPDYSQKNLTSKLLVDSTAESKDYYVTRKYNPDEFNESTDKKSEVKKSYELTERNWGLPEKNYELPNRNLPTIYGKPEENYEVDESVSVMTNGRVHGIQIKPTDKPLQQKPDDDNQKVGYVVEGRNYKKYRVEERTADGFIVGEYGVVSTNDGSLRGVRYTADGTINPRVIYDALMKFLSL